MAAISTGQTDALLTLGLVPAGATRDERGSLYPDYLRQAYPAAQAGFAATVDLGNRVTPDLEALAALRPDLILVHRTVLKPGVLALLQRIAPTVVTRGTGAHWKADFVLLADAVGRRDQARAWLASFAADARRAAGERPGVAPQVSFV
ncbi:MAG: putative siderophore-binding lipoprotein YfiY [Paracidovorax wautersii]|uniref:Putative siderophore-binding lipoprotein YfiY n=1 Tax=Paracidovorax wautersii TaxID=1177982 RepID=A0A7V8JQ80_9BURK|nr:MAG: putative siderophore-binding lipoprotein YfiY [Paracidovorax wautersii]